MDVQINDGVIWPPPTAKFEVSNDVSIPVAEFLMLSFSHHMEILSGAKTLEERIFYIHKAAQNELRRQLAIAGDAPTESEDA